MRSTNVKYSVKHIENPAALLQLECMKMSEYGRCEEMESHGSFHLKGGSYAMMPGRYIHVGPGGMAQGNGTLVVPAGSNLQVKAASGDCVYYMDGEYVTP